MAVRLYGNDDSVYVRIARLTLAEKGVDYDLVPVDPFAEGGPPDWYRALHPFGRIPAFEHDGLRLFETAAIARYVDDAFDGPPLQPTTPRERAVMNQIIGLLDSYAYRAMVWDVYVERMSKPRRGVASDEARIAAAIPVAATVVETLARLNAPGQWLLGKQLTLADLHAAPMFAYFAKAPEGATMLAENPEMLAWWRAISYRSSFTGTEPGQ